MRGSVMRFVGARGDLLVAASPTLSLVDAAGHVQFHTEIGEFIDVVPVDDEVWVAGVAGLTRLAHDGALRGVVPLELGADGRFRTSSAAPQIPVWQTPGRATALLREPMRAEAAGPGGAFDAALPLPHTQWLLWADGLARRWRREGEVWRTTLGEPGEPLVDAQVVLDGRLFVIAQALGDGRELHLSGLEVSDGTPHLALRVSDVEQLVFAAHRGLAVARTPDRLRVIDLRHGMWIRDLALPRGTEAIAVDDGLRWIALARDGGVEVVRPEALAMGIERATLGTPDDDADIEARSLERVPPRGEADDALPTGPLVRLRPLTVTPNATAPENAQAIELRLQHAGARAALAIARAWNSGRIARPDPSRLPFADEVEGLLGIGSQARAIDQVARATERLVSVEEMLANAARSRVKRQTPLDVLAAHFQLSPTAVEILFAIVAPRLRGQLARLYAIVANDPGRSTADEYLLGQLLGEGHAALIARELDADRPLRRYGLIQVAGGDRPFAALSVDPVVTRFIASQPQEGEPDPHLSVRAVDRELDELELPRALVARAMTYLGSDDAAPARIVLRGRTGAGRHTLMCSLAARAGRSLGVIDLSTAPRDPTAMAAVLDVTLRRALLRGLLPCVDGLELLGEDQPDARPRLGAVLREYPGPLAVRLPGEAPIPLDPGYLRLDLPQRDERSRLESWNAALVRHQIELADARDLAARYRVGPGIIHRVCAEVARRPDRPSEPAGWLARLEGTLGQHLENRLGKTATRVHRLATWADVVLPGDIVDSLLELTARVRHRRTVFEQWGFDHSITTSRGITALFQGGPGTGKTMVAGVIARELGLELYRVDVSRITSKWLGETEKNLGQLFDAAEEGQVMLLFDEADSLFGKRTEVKTSVDRYANMEVNYLLQRLDSFEGVAILTTNFGTALDPAFKRRLTYRVTFPFPDEEMREQLWRSLIPPQAPLEGPIDFAHLAQRFRLSGGYIRNAALRAAFLAAEEGTSLSQGHLERAIRMEFREIGKLAETGALE